MICRVSFVEDQTEIADYLKDVLFESVECELISSYNNAEDAIAFMPKMSIDVAIVDIGLPGLSGIECVRRLLPMMKDTQFMVYTVFEEDDQVFNALLAGAKGYLLKGSSNSEIIRAINEINKGGSPMSPLIARKVVNRFSGHKIQENTKLTNILTARETSNDSSWHCEATYP